ncbi:MAG TPA: tetratricopeptide repeat protein [Thermoanaerobaculia bacterium]|nr:tetratricopeptide repeat protein [Thermoanaerobaculia bacterium]
MRHRCTLIAVLILALPLAAEAQQPAGELQQRFVQARQKYEAQDYKGVVDLLEPYKADSKVPTPFLTLLGGAYIELGRFQEAQAILDPIAAGETAGPPLLFNAARAALALKQEAKGEAYLQRAAAKSPQSIATRALGLRYGRQGKVLDAYKLLRPWAKDHPEDQEARLAAAFCAVELGRGPEEIEELLSGLPQDLPQVRVLRARFLLSQGDPRGAIAMLAPLEAAPPKEVEHDLRWTLGEARVQVGEAAGAVAVLEGHVGDDPELALLLAQAHQQTGSPEKVLVTLKPFVDRLPNPSGSDTATRALYASIALEHARALVAGGRWAEALPVLEKAAALDESSPTIWQVYGQALAGAGRREEAQKALARFQELSKAAAGSGRNKPKQPGQEPTDVALSEAARLSAAGQADKALEVIRREREVATDDLRLRFMEVQLLLILKRFDEASKAAEETLKVAPGNADALYQRGAVNLALNKRAEAERDFRQALAVLPEHLAALNDLAVLLIAEGRKPEARELLQKVLSLRPDDPMAKANLQSLEGR